MVKTMAQILFITGVLLLLAAIAAAVILHKRKMSKEYIGNDNYTPPLPISNIIIDKKRYIYDAPLRSERHDGINVSFTLTDVLSGLSRKIKMKKEITIGSSQKCRLVIRDREVSPVHCRICFDGAQLLISDNNSANGTILNGIMISGRVPLYNGDLIMIGGCEFKLGNIERRRVS